MYRFFFIITYTTNNAREICCFTAKHPRCKKQPKQPKTRQYEYKDKYKDKYENEYEYENEDEDENENKEIVLPPPTNLRNCIIAYCDFLLFAV